MPTLRPAYRELQVLRAADLEAEQRWRQSQRRRHLLHHHSPGIVRGLTLHAADAEDGITIKVGFAIDSEGYELRLSRPVTLPHTSLAQSARKLAEENGQQRPPATLDLWLHRGEETPRGTSPPNTPVRMVARPVLRITTADTRGAGVYLGRIASSKGPGALEHFVTQGPSPVSPPPDTSSEDPTPPEPVRQHTCSIGSQLACPTKHTVFDLGRRHRGTVEVRTRSPEGLSASRLTLHPQEGHTVAGNTRLRQGLHTDSIAWNQPTIEPTEPAPWKIHRTSTGEDGEELRIELPPRSVTDSGKKQRLSVGRRGENGAFEAILRVSADGSTTVGGHLVLEGRLVESPIRADIADPRFTARLSQHWRLGAATSVIQSLAQRHAALVLTVHGRSTQDRANNAIHHAYHITNLGAAELHFDLDALDSGLVEGRHRIATQHSLNPRETAVLLRTLHVPHDARGLLTTVLEVTGRVADGRQTHRTTRLEVLLDGGTVQGEHP